MDAGPIYLLTAEARRDTFVPGLWFFRPRRFLAAAPCGTAAACGVAAAPRSLAVAIEGLGSRALLCFGAGLGRRPGARIKRGARCADAGPNTRVPKNTPDASRTSRPLNLAFSRKARPEGFAIRCPVWPRTFGLVGQQGPKTLPPGEPFPPRGLSDSRAHDPEGPERVTHALSKRVWLQSQNPPAMQIPVDSKSGHAQFIHRFSTGPFRATAPAAVR